MHGDYSTADTMYSKAAEIYRKIASKTGAASDSAMAATAMINIGENAFKLPDYSRSESYFKAGLKVYEEALSGLGQYDRAQYLAWLSYYRLVCERDYDAAFDAAYEAYQLQPDNVLVFQILGYACLYVGYYDDAEMILTAVGNLGGGQAEMIRRDLEAQEQAGLWNERIPELIHALDAIS